MRFKVDDKVRMISRNPFWGAGGVNVGDVGIIIDFVNYGGESGYRIDFKGSSDYWAGIDRDLELVEEVQEPEEKSKKRKIIIIEGE